MHAAVVRLFLEGPVPGSEDRLRLVPVAGRVMQLVRAEGARVEELVDPGVDPRHQPEQPFLPALTEFLRRSLG